MSGIPDWQLTPNGTIKPIYERDIVNPITGKAEFAVAPESFAAILEGYACGNCLEYGQFKGTWLPKCPTCGEETGADRQITSEWWTDSPTVKL